jgi:hypothetical protein
MINMHKNFRLGFPQKKNEIAYHVQSSRMQTIGFIIPLFYLLISVLLSCGVDVEDSIPPNRPQWVAKSLPEEWPERGIDAHESGGIFIEWYPVYEANVIGYHILRAQYFNSKDSVGKFEFITYLDVKTLFSTDYVDRTASSGRTYYYTLQAEDGAGNLSERADSIHFTLLTSNSPYSLVPDGLNEILDIEIGLSWVYHYSLEMEDYIITVISEEGDLIVRDQFSPTNFTEDWESWPIPPSISLQSGMHYQWRIDIGADYHNGYESSGSESSWAKFKYISP